MIEGRRSRAPESKFSGQPERRAAREVQLDTPLRRARTCYNHLAGVAGVGILDEMLRRGWLQPTSSGERAEYELTAEGALALVERRVDIAGAQRTCRRLAYGCPDWTEGRPHLAGALATAILDRLVEDGVIERAPDSRAVRQERSLASWFDAPSARAANTRV